jgi:hypothetical protein
MWIVNLETIIFWTSLDLTLSSQLWYKNLVNASFSKFCISKFFISNNKTISFPLLRLVSWQLQCFTSLSCEL